MDEPVFKLEGVIKTRDELEDFEGPLIVILQLLSKNKIAIQDVKISLLLDQYLAYLDERKAMDLDIASEFVAMAAHLVFIKARMLLSAGEDRSELDELVSSLEKLQNRDVYAKIKGVTGELREMYTRGAGMIAKPPEYLAAPDYQYVHEKRDLLETMISILAREEAAAVMRADRTVAMPKPMVYSVSEKSEEILKRLKKCKRLSLREILSSSGSRTELIAAFISVLELCASGRIMLTGDDGAVELGHSA